jgi:hypothetical protein
MLCLDELDMPASSCFKNKRRSVKKGSIWMLTIGLSLERKMRSFGGLVLPKRLKTRNEPRDIQRELALERIGCRAADMPHGEMVNAQLSSFSVRHFCSTKRIKNIPRSEDNECPKLISINDCYV